MRWKYLNIGKPFFFFVMLGVSTSIFADTIESRRNTKVQLVVDTLKVQNIEDSKKAKDNANMPWVVALTIGVLSVGVNIYIADRNKRGLEKQVSNSKEIALSQIANTKELAIFEFNKTLNSKNRQEWITDIRKSISELISQTKLLNIEFNEDQNTSRRKELMEKVTFHRTHIFLLLSPKDNKPLHKSLQNAIIDLFNLLDSQLLIKEKRTDLNSDFLTKSEAVIEEGRKLVYGEWQKIQEMK